MDFEQIKELLENYLTTNNLKYFKRSDLAKFAIDNGFELEDINNLFENDYCNNVTEFREKIGDTAYRRYVLGNLNNRQIASVTGLKLCSGCGCFSATSLTTTNGKTFCCERCANYNGFYTCTECGKLAQIEVNTNDFKLCKECCENHAEKYNVQKCSCCERYFVATSLYKVGELQYCRACTSSIRVINSYHGTRRNYKTYKKNREKLVTFGYENEFEIKNDTPKTIVALAFKDLLKKQGLTDFFFFENDGSLNTGFEAISHPFTLAWLYENENKLKAVYDFLLANGCTAEKTCTTGLHIHFNRKALSKDFSLAKIAFLINKLQYDFVRFSNRKLNELYYTEFDRFYNNDGEIRLKDFKRVYNSNTELNSNHSAVVNRQHEHTIEIRLFKGTLDLQRIIANVELVSNLIYYVENHSETEVENVTFKELCLFKKTKYLKQLYYKTFEPNTKLKAVS